MISHTPWTSPPRRTAGGTRGTPRRLATLTDRAFSETIVATILSSPAAVNPWSKTAVDASVA